MNISLTGYVPNECKAKCSGSCAYCTAASTMDYSMSCNKNHLVEDLIKIDEYMSKKVVCNWDKVYETLEHTRQFREEMRKPEEQRFLHVDLWLADPVTCFIYLKEAFAKMKEFADKHNIKLTFSSSTNGLPLARTEIIDWAKEHNVTFQLSHDGIGQWIRTGNFDPIWDIPNAIPAIRDGVVNAVNCTLSFYNNDLRMNMRYWNKVLAEAFPAIYSKSLVCTQDEENIFRRMYIKLNHIYDGQYDLKALNKDGRYNNKCYEELKGKPLGNMNFRNWTDNPYTGELHHLFAHNLDDYMHGYYNIAMVLRDPISKNSPSWIPFASYFMEQSKRWKVLRSHNERTGACRAYQRYVKGIGTPDSWQDETFVVDTLGNFSQCNLISSNFDVENPGGEQPDYCKWCHYEMQSECNKCGSVAFPDHCEYSYRWVQFLEQMIWLDECLRSNIQNNKRD